jgi:hypothetical protein
MKFSTCAREHTRPRWVIAKMVLEGRSTVCYVIVLSALSPEAGNFFFRPS